MGDPTRGGPPRDDPEATQIGAPPEDAVGESTGDLSGAASGRSEWASRGGLDPTRVQPTPAMPPSTDPLATVPPTSSTAPTHAASSPAAGSSRPAASAYAGPSTDQVATRRTYTRAAPGGGAVRPRRRRGPRVTVARVAVPVVFLAAVIAVLSLSVRSGVIGGKEASKKPAAVVTGKATTKGSASPTAKARRFYRVRAGDTLGALAIKFHTTENRIMILNNLSSTTLRVGQRLRLPPPGQ